MIELQGNEEISLRDAIAIDFFLEHINLIFNGDKDEENYLENVVLLAQSSLHIGEIFCETRKKFNASQGE